MIRCILPVRCDLAEDCACGSIRVAPEKLDGNLQMEQLAFPATLGGLILCIAWGAWALGRWQGEQVRPDVPIAAEHPATLPQSETENPARAVGTGGPASPCQQNARDERLCALQDNLSLADLHDEVSAYRHREQVFATLAPGALRFGRVEDPEMQECRYIGLTGQPICPAPGAARLACTKGCGIQPGADLPAFVPAEIRADQPSPGGSAFTRV